MQVAQQVNKAHSETKGVKVLLENMSGQGSALGSTFEELRQVLYVCDGHLQSHSCVLSGRQGSGHGCVKPMHAAVSLKLLLMCWRLKGLVSAASGPSCLLPDSAVVLSCA